MSLDQILATANLIAIVAIPFFGAMLKRYHEENRTRWEWVIASIKAGKASDKRLNKQIKKIERRIDVHLTQEERLNNAQFDTRSA